MTRKQWIPASVVCLALLAMSSGSEASGGSDSRTAVLQFTTGGHVLGFAPTAVTMAAGDHALRVEFVGTPGVEPVGEGSAAAATGKAGPLGRVSYPGMWEGIDLAYDTAQGGFLRSTWAIAPGADPGRIRMRYNVPVARQGDGSLRLGFPTGWMSESAPVAWQELDGKRVMVDVAFRSPEDREIGFTLGKYDRKRELWIDPTLAWNTLLGSSGSEYGNISFAVDGGGNIYLAGRSPSSWGSPMRPHAGGSDAVVAKLSSAGVLQWSTFLGGSADDQSAGITVDASGNIFVTGTSVGTWGNPLQAFSGGADAFVAKLNNDGDLQWNTFFGSSAYGTDGGIAVDASGGIYVTGSFAASWGSPLRPFTDSPSDAHVTKLDSAGLLQWSTFLGSSAADVGSDIRADGAGNVYVTGCSYASWGSPVLAFSGSREAFVAKLSDSGVLQWNTFSGLSTSTDAFGLALDGNGNTFITGFSGCSAFVEKFDGQGQPSWNNEFTTACNMTGASTIGFDIAVDGSGKIFVAGGSGGTWGSPVQAYNDNGDAFVAQFDGEGALQWNTFLGSSMGDSALDIAVDGAGSVIVAGYSAASWGNPLQAYSGSSDLFVAKFRGRPVKNDFDGDVRTDLAVYHRAAGDWYAAYSGGGYLLGYTMGWSEAVPVPGDYDGDGKTDLAVYHQAAGDWYVLYSGGGYLLGYTMGWSEAVPVPGDYDGDGKTDLAVYHQAAGDWYIAYSGGGYLLGYTMGWSQAVPVPGDYDGDGKTDLAVYHRAAGDWYIAYSDGGYLLGCTMGWSQAVPVPGDYDGDGKTDLAVYHQAAGNWYIAYSGGGYLLDYTMGWSEAVPVPGDYDGDGKTDMAVYHQAAGDWYIAYSGGGYLLDYNMGWSEAFPVGGY